MIPVPRVRFLLPLLLLAALSSVAAARPAQAAKFSGAYLLQLCELKDGKEVVKGGSAACQSYISGILDYHLVLQSLKIAPKLDVCVPPDVSLNQLHAIVLNYLRANPQHDGFIAAPAVLLAIYQVYPCRAAKRKKR
jgi:hypothetical protein